MKSIHHSRPLNSVSSGPRTSTALTYKIYPKDRLEHGSMESLANKARLPSIRELELELQVPASTRGFTEPTNFSPYALSPTFSQFPSPPALEPSVNGNNSSNSSSNSSSARPSAGVAGGDERGGPFAGQQGTSVSHIVHSGAQERLSGADIAPLSAADLGAAHSRPHALASHPLSANGPFNHSYSHNHPPPHPSLSLDRTLDTRPFITTPPRSPDQTPLAAPNQSLPGFPGRHAEASSDEAIAETRRQRRESKERRRRKDQRSLTVVMERSVPSWVFNRLKTRHSASKVNGGGRATNAVISGACIWLGVMNRALREQLPPSDTDEGKKPIAARRWLQLVDEEAAALENYELDDDSAMDLS